MRFMVVCTCEEDQDISWHFLRDVHLSQQDACNAQKRVSHSISNRAHAIRMRSGHDGTAADVEIQCPG